LDDERRTRTQGGKTQEKRQLVSGIPAAFAGRERLTRSNDRGELLRKSAQLTRFD